MPGEPCEASVEHHPLPQCKLKRLSAVAVQVQAAQQMAQMRAEFPERELLQQIESLQSQLATSSGIPNGADMETRVQNLEARIDFVYTQFQAMERDTHTLAN